MHDLSVRAETRQQVAGANVIVERDVLLEQSIEKFLAYVPAEALTRDPKNDFAKECTNTTDGDDYKPLPYQGVDTFIIVVKVIVCKRIHHSADVVRRQEVDHATCEHEGHSEEH